MADKKISALTASTTPLAGTEVLPIVQGGATVKVAVSNLTAGRPISATQLTLSTENLVIGTAGKGIDFSANTHAAGMTSELLNDYEEGTFTPTIIGVTSAGTGTYSTQTGTYTKVGRLVSVQIVLTWTAHTGTGTMKVAGLPFTVSASVANPIAIAAYDMVNPASTILGGVVNISATTIELLSLPVGGGAWSGVAMDTDVPALVISGQYFV